jgi:chromosome segregation ATPase
MGLWMFTNFEMYPSFLDSARCAAWSAIKELGERLKWRLHNTQQDLKEENEDTTALKETMNQLQRDLEQLVTELSVQGELIKNKDEQISNLQKQLDQQWICMKENQEALVGLPYRIYNNRRRVIDVYGHTNLWMIVLFVCVRTSLLVMMNVC